MNLGFETETLEHKKSTSEIKEACISIASILNKHREGVLYFGVKNNGDVVGQEIGVDTTREISHKILEQVRPMPNITVDTLKSDDDKIYIRVKFNGNSRPYSAFGKYYNRSSDEDREASQSQLRDMFMDVYNYSDWESMLTEYTADDINEKLLRDSYDDGLVMGRFKDAYNNKESVLSRLKLLRDGKLTNAGNLLFSKNEPLLLKAALFATDTKITILDHIQFNGNIYECIKESIAFISKHIRWRAAIGPMNRVDIPEIPVEAIREIVINAFAHAKYSHIVSAHEIDIFPNSIRISNPGRLPLSVNPEEYATEAKDSYLVNPTIATVLYRTNKIEAFATGFRKVFSLCTDAEIHYSYHNEEHGFVFEFNRKSLFYENELSTLKDTELAVYQLIKADAKITIESIAASVAKTSRTVMRAINSLRTNGFIKRIGGTYKGKWMVLK
jgi:ATP-dependent DNA helicase RecG